MLGEASFKNKLNRTRSCQKTLSKATPHK